MFSSQFKQQYMTAALAAGVVILVILVVATAYFRQSDEAQRAANLKLTPTPIFDSSGNVVTPTPDPYEKTPASQIIKNRTAEPVLKQQKVMTSQERATIVTVKTELPVVTDDYEIGYSDYTNTFYIYLKTANAQQLVDTYFSSKNLSGFRTNYPKLFQTVTVPVVPEMRRIENDLFKSRLQAKGLSVKGVATVNAQEQPAVSTNDDPNIPNQKDAITVPDFFRNLLKGIPDDSEIDTKGKAGGGSGTGGSGGGLGGNFPGGTLPPNSDLAKIFNEVATKVGTPAKLLQAVMRQECGRLLDPGYTTDAQIAAWATPGQGLPVDHYCFDNGIGAMGPMQFYEPAGSFITYGGAVNEYGGYTHTPYIENVRDSVYAAGLKLRAESDGAVPGTVWNESQVRHAIICYNAGCGWLDDPPAETLAYFDAVWQEYSAN